MAAPLTPRTLAALVQSQASLIAQLQLSQEASNASLKQSILEDLKADLAAKKSPKKKARRRRAPTPEEYEREYDQYEREEEDEDLTNEGLDAPNGNNNITINSNANQIRQPRSHTQPLPQTRSSSNLKNHSPTSTLHNMSSTALPQAYSQPASSAAMSATRRTKKKGSRTGAYKPIVAEKTIPLDEFNTGQSDAPLDVTTLRFLEQSAALINSSTGKSANSILANTFNQPEPLPMPTNMLPARNDTETSILRLATSQTIPATPNTSWFPPTTPGATPGTTPGPVNAPKRGPSRGGPSRASTRGGTAASHRPRTVGPSTVATVRAEAESLGAKLLGPLNLNGGQEKAPLPSQLTGMEWENELARNILSLYSNQVVQTIKMRKEEEEQARKVKARRDRRIKELKAEGLSDKEVEEIVSSERFDRATRSPRGTRRTRKTGTARSPSRQSSTGGSTSRMDRSTNDFSNSMSGAAKSVLSGLMDGVDVEQHEDVRQLSRQMTGASEAPSRRAKSNEEEAATARKSANKAVVAPIRPKPIWFGGTGAVQAEWSALEEFLGGGQGLRKNLEAMKEKGKYTQYIATVEGLLSAGMRGQADTHTTQLMERLWRQMVVACNAFGIRCLEQRKYPKALELLERANELAGYEDVIPHHLVQELKAFVMDSFSYYYMRRHKPSAALQYITNAMKAHTKRRDWPHVAKCHLHTACILSKLERHDEAIRCLGQVLSMVDDGSLDVGTNNAQQLLLVSVAYHNIAVEQLILRHVSEACVSSQNARRLARLCLSYSNRYLPNFEATHVVALKELAASVRHKQNGEQHEIFKQLAKGLYS